MRARIGIESLLKHGLNMWISKDIIEEHTETIDAEGLRIVRDEKSGKCYASLEDTILWCLQKYHTFIPLLPLATMMYVSKKVDIEYMLQRAKKLGMLKKFKRYISFIHHVMTGETIEEIPDIHYKVRERYLKTHSGIEKHILHDVRSFKPLSPYEVVIESWKQMRVEK